ncbi:MAG TPA: response regulator [Beijerinckiaceae bacterium]|jgi:CheY-like chemotaxis protein
MSGPSLPLEGLSVLVVEDETIVAFMIEDMAAELGAAEVRHAGGVAAALKLIAARRPDAAVLDVNLGGAPIHPVAERLDALAVPFVFATGYGRQGVPPQWAGRPVLQKPFPAEALARVLREALGR